MSTLTFNSTGAYYHQVGADGQGATAWVAGGPRKGVENGMTCCGAYTFDGPAIQAQISLFPAYMALTLTRESGYGTGTISVTLAPIYDRTPDGTMTHEEALAVGHREWHYTTTVSGASSTINLPGAYLAMLGDGAFNGIMIYQEDDSTSDPVRFTSSATLVTNDGVSFAQPVWMRTISPGDLISGPTRSHTEDLAELLYYINVRRLANHLGTYDGWNGYTIGLYAHWGRIIEWLRTLADDFYYEEHNQQEHITWNAVIKDETDPQNPIYFMPVAAAINELRNYLDSFANFKRETITQYARATFSGGGSSSSVNTTTATSWPTSAPKCGTYWEYNQISETLKEKVWYKCFGVWLFGDIVQSAGIVNDIKLIIKRTGGTSSTQTYTLYAAVAPSIPSTNKTVDYMIDRTFVCGTMNVANGETVTVTLNDAAKAALISGDITGVAVTDTSPYGIFGGNATVIINEGT